MELKELVKLVEEWGDSKGITNPDNGVNQYKKFIEEIGEAAKEVFKGNKEGIKTEFGDVAVTIILLSKINNNRLNLEFIEKSLTDNFYWFMEKVTPTYIYSSALDRLNDVSEYYGFHIVECLEEAYNKISKRTGKTENGIFKKD